MAQLDARCAVLCAWVFDLEGGGEPPFGFQVLDILRGAGNGYLGAVLHGAGPDGGIFVVNRGTRFDTRSPGALFGGLKEDLGTAGAILAGAAAIPALDAAVAAALAVQARWPNAGALRFTGQSLGGGLAQLQGAACLAARARNAALPDIRVVTFGAMDVSRTLRRRLSAELQAALGSRAENAVSDRDGLTGPRGVLGTSAVGEQRVVRDMDGPRPGGAFAFHRARAWVNHCEGLPVDAPERPHPRDWAGWDALRRRGWLPPGWPAERD
ncbi:hypothetical protein ACE7GA_16340 [Roseomonas sp. CCTCC AB2023176]|uniref:hypothetical protein n=1 Tax=Roseomonas sp. CCTCC AB2023176 TaxID=3342640 RepID=UPI0035D7B8D9